MNLNPSGLCQCGCGEPTKVAAQRYVYDGIVVERGEHFRFIQNHHRRLSPVEYVVDEATGCWLWQGGLYKDGYGAKWDAEAKRQVRAHRWYYEQKHGPIPDGMVLDHVWERGCRHRHCVNPDHTEPVTNQENIHRGARGALKTECRHGHPWIPENIYVAPGTGRKSCLICRRDRSKARSG